MRTAHALSAPLLTLTTLTSPTLAVTQARPGFAVGHVTLPDGTPVAGAVVRVDGTNDLGGLQSFMTTTDATGADRQRVIGGLDTVTAWVPRTDNGVSGYITTAEPTRGTETDEFDPHKGGIVRDFVWKVSGAKSGDTHTDGRAFYGGWGAVGTGSPTTTITPAWDPTPRPPRSN